MEDLGSDFSEECPVCGEQVPEPCAVPGCPDVEQSCQCGDEGCEDPGCLLAHAEQTYHCVVCGKEVQEGFECDRPDCPRVAAAKLRKAALDTPFKLGL